MTKYLFPIVQYSKNLCKPAKSIRPTNLCTHIRSSSTLSPNHKNIGDRKYIKSIFTLNKFHITSRDLHRTLMDSPVQHGITGELRAKAHRICCKHLGGAWEKITSDQMSLTPITGGMSNLLYCCSLPDSEVAPEGEPSQVLLRLYGEQSRNCDMSLQVQIFELLSKKDLGPKLYGNFDEGRLEEFLHATSLTPDQLMNHEISSVIARKIAVVHSLDVPSMSKKDSWLYERFHEWSEFINNHKKSPVDYADGLLCDATLKIADRLLAIDFEQEMKFVRQIIDGICSPIVFSHNDLHQGNILLVKPTKRRSLLEQQVILIDFEYCSYNYRAYDIANHFCEWCFDYDTPEYPHFLMRESRFPPVDRQREFIKNYLEQRAKTTISKKSTHDNVCTSQLAHGYNSKLYMNNNGILHDNNNQLDRAREQRWLNVSNKQDIIKETTTSDQEIDKILKEVKPFCMVANLVWTLWCIKSAYVSNIKFGFWEHAWSRWQMYSDMKQSYLANKSQRGRLVNSIKGITQPIVTQKVDIDARR